MLSPLIAPSLAAVPGLVEPKYTPLPRPKGLTVGTLSPGEAPMGVTPMVNYERRTLPSIPAWYNDRKPTSADCEYICKQDADCMEQSFDAALASCALFGKVSDKPSPSSSSPPSPAPLPSSAASSAALTTPASAAELRGVVEGTTLRRKPAHGNYTNPIVCSNSPDPGAIVHGPLAETVVVVATGGNVESGAFPLWHSTDGGLSFELRRYALPEAPKWWDEEALESMERMQAFVNGSRGPGHASTGSRTKERSALGSTRVSKELLAKEWAKVKLWAPEIHKLGALPPIPNPNPNPDPNPSPNPSPNPNPNPEP